MPMVASAFPLAHHYRSVLGWLGVLKFHRSEVSEF